MKISKACLINVLPFLHLAEPFLQIHYAGAQSVFGSDLKCSNALKRVKHACSRAGTFCALAGEEKGVHLPRELFEWHR